MHFKDKAVPTCPLITMLLHYAIQTLYICAQIKEKIEQIHSLQSDLSSTHHKPLPPIPMIRPEEVPERQFEYTRESLLRFKEEKAAREEAERQAAAGAGEGGFFGGFGGGGGDGDGGGGDGEAKKEDAKVADGVELEVCIMWLVGWCTVNCKFLLWFEGLDIGDVKQSDFCLMMSYLF